MHHGICLDCGCRDQDFGSSREDAFSLAALLTEIPTLLAGSRSLSTAFLGQALRQREYFYMQVTVDHAICRDILAIPMRSRHTTAPL
jgi:hypothetical protein